MSKQPPGAGSAVPLETIARALAPFRQGLAERELAAVQTYLSLLLTWNRAINLTAIEDPAEMLCRHFGESLFAASLLEINGSSLADVGTGAGFPGLPLKIVSPEMQLTLIESNLKKCAFLAEVVQRLQLSGVEIRKERFENVGPSGKPYDFVCSRALGAFSTFLPWAREVLAPGGAIVLWLGTDESTRLGRRKEFRWESPVPIPESRRRVILIGRRAA